MDSPINIRAKKRQGKTVIPLAIEPSRYIDHPCPTCGTKNATIINPVWLRYVRTNWRMSQIDFAKRIGVSKDTVRFVEQGRIPCSEAVYTHYLQHYVRFLKCKI